MNEDEVLSEAEQIKQLKERVKSLEMQLRVFIAEKERAETNATTNATTNPPTGIDETPIQETETVDPNLTIIHKSIVECRCKFRQQQQILKKAGVSLDDEERERLLALNTEREPLFFLIFVSSFSFISPHANILPRISCRTRRNT